MDKPVTDSAYVVVVTHGTGDFSQTTWPTAETAMEYIQRLRRDGFSLADVRFYRARLARPAPSG